MIRLQPLRPTLRPASLCLVAGICATTALAQDQGLRELERYREVSPSEDIPALTTRSFSLRPESAIDLGFTRIHGFLEERVVFDDNVFLSKHDERSDTIFQTSPGLRSQTYFGDHRLALSYAPTHLSYAHRSELNTWDHLANADLRLDFVDAYARIADTFERTHETRDIRLPGRVSRETNDLQAEAGLLDGYSSVGILGEHRTRTYGNEVPAFEDFTENGLKVLGRYGQTADHTWLAEYGILVRDFDDDVLNDTVTHTALGGLEAVLQEGVRGLVRAGPVWVRADDDGSVGDDSDHFGLSAEAEVTAELWDDVSSRLWYVQRPEFATFSNFQRVRRGGLDVTWDAEPGLIEVRGQLFAEKANPSNQEALTLIGTGIGVDVDVTRWCKVGLGWEWRDRSGTGDLDYARNQVYLQAVIYF